LTISRCGAGRREDWNRRYSETEFLWSAEPNRVLVSEVAGLPPGRALDLACGEGRNAVWLAGQGWQVTGVDFAEVGLARAAELARDRGVDVDWLRADLIEYPSPAGAFDLVCVLYLQLPAEELAIVLPRAAEALAPGGTLLVLGHDLTNLEEGHGGPRNPAVLFTPEDVAALLPELVVERAERVGRPVEGGAVAIDALVRARMP